MMTKVSNEWLAEMQSEAAKAVEAGIGDWQFKSPIVRCADAHSIFTELLSLRNAQSEAVAVKPLEWKPNSASSLWTGELAFGAYYVAYDEDDGWRAFRRQFMSESDGVEVAFGAKDTVLSAAQADYEQRIRSTLAHPAPPLAVTDGMVERACATFEVYASLQGEVFSRFRSNMRAALTAALEAKQ